LVSLRFVYVIIFAVRGYPLSLCVHMHTNVLPDGAGRGRDIHSVGRWRGMRAIHRATRTHTLAS